MKTKTLMRLDEIARWLLAFAVGGWIFRGSPQIPDMVIPALIFVGAFSAICIRHFLLKSIKKEAKHNSRETECNAPH